jgi:hypothetical protein
MPFHVQLSDNCLTIYNKQQFSVFAADSLSVENMTSLTKQVLDENICFIVGYNDIYISP